MKYSSRHVFWQALVIALVIFCGGILVGMFFENSRIEKLEDFYFTSKTELLDFELFSEILYEDEDNCDIIKESSVLLADKIYVEALKLEKYDNSNKITEDLITLHKRYDLLRTLLWKKIIENKKICNLDTVVYLYKYDNPDLNTKAIQETMSNFLLDLKREKGSEIILIPIAVDTDLISLNYLIEGFNISQFPVVIINEEYIISNLDSMEDLETYLK